MNILAMGNESTCDGQRKYFRFLRVLRHLFSRLYHFKFFWMNSTDLKKISSILSEPFDDKL